MSWEYSNHGVYLKKATKMFPKFSANRAGHKYLMESTNQHKAYRDRSCRPHAARRMEQAAGSLILSLHTAKTCPFDLVFPTAL